MASRRASRAEAVRAFKSDADALESLPLPFPGRTLLYLVIGLVAAAVAWASLSSVDRIVVAQGRLVTTAPRIVVQALETSIIKELHVKEGDRVRGGQLLATLDATFVTADITALSSQRERVTAQIERLGAEVADRDYRPVHENTATGLQVSIHRHKRAEVNARLTSFDRKTDELHATKAVNASRIVRIGEQIEAVTQLEAMRAEALRKGAGSRLEVIEVQINRLELLENLEALEKHQVEIDNRLRSNAAEREMYVRTGRRKTFEELIETRQRLDALEEPLTKALRRGKLIRLSAAKDAIVFEMAERSVGSILREAEVLMTLVPQGTDIELLVELAPLYVGKVKVADPTRIKIDAFPFQVYGTLDGEVRTISSDAFVEESGAQKTLSYRAHIVLHNHEFSRRSAGSPLRPGMTVTAEIIVGRRSVISYLLYPVIRALDEAAREP